MSDTPIPNNPDAYPLSPAAPGVWYSSVSCTSSGGTDTYTGLTTDGSNFSISVPTGTPQWKALGLPAPAHITCTVEAFETRFSGACLQWLAQNDIQLLLTFAARAGANDGMVDVTNIELVDGLTALTSVPGSPFTSAIVAQILNLAVSSP